MKEFEQGKVLAKIAQYWPDTEPREIMCELDEYGARSFERERVRVQLAILKLSDGHRDRLAELVSMAKKDYRDVLAYAEYPEEMTIGFIEMTKLSPKEVQAVRKRDETQYYEWLEG